MNMRLHHFYLFILLVVLSACSREAKETTQPDPVIEIRFGSLSATAGQHQAVIQAQLPVCTLDGTPSSNFTYGLEYRLTAESNWSAALDVTVQGEQLTYTLTQLQPATSYTCRQWAQVQGEPVRYGSPIDFSTQEETPPENEYALSLEIGTVTPYGLYATVELRQLTYLINGQASPIHSSKLEFRAAEQTSWQSMLLNDWDYQSPYPVEIPQTGTLQEETDYVFRIQAIATAEGAEACYSELHSFTTREATASVVQSAPTVDLSETAVTLSVQPVEIWLDERYPQTDYQAVLQLREANTSSWKSYPADVSTDGYTITLQLEALEPDTDYQARGVVTYRSTEYMTDVTTFTTPQKETPDPPVGGDTGLLAGTWHLVEWRTQVPDFEVYICLNETGDLTLWQKMESRIWECFQSVARLDGNIISGTYLDGTPWGASYYFVLEQDKMIWTDTEDPSDISVYERSTLPQELEPAPEGIRRQSEEENSRFL